jgi:uncharacterized protein
MYDIIVGRSKHDREKYGTRGAVLLGRQYVTMGQTTSLSNNVYMDMVRSHIVLIVGKRGSGKCLHGDTLITLTDGSCKKVKNLEQDANGIYTLNADLRIKEGEKSHFYKRTVGKLLEITLRSGKSIKVTPEHPFFTVKGWLPAEQLNPGARIATPRVLPSFGDKAIEIERVKLLAYLIAEGHLGNGFVLFSNADQKIVRDFKDATITFDTNLRVDHHSSPVCYRVSQIKKQRKVVKRNVKGQFIEGPPFAHSSIRQWLENLELYGTTSLNKFIPDPIFTAPKHQVALFLNRLFSCKGTICRKANHWFVSYCSSSDELITQVQHLLLRFGILSKIRRKLINNKFPTNELEIYGENVHTYLQEVGFYGKKEERAKIALKEAIKIVRNPNVDTIPKEVWNLYRPRNWAAVGRKLGHAHPKALRESTRYSPYRQKLLQIARADESELIEKFATSDIFWDEITSLKYLEEECEVYDLTIPETHNFVANDIIVHNSYTMGAIAEGMADMPMDIKQNLSIILLDTMGVYWTMKYPNKKEIIMLQDWGFQPKALDVQIYTPTKFHHEYKEKGIPTDFSFALQPSELTPEDWCLSFDVDINKPIGVFIERIVNHLRDSHEDGYSIEEMIAAIDADTEVEQSVRQAAKNRFLNTTHWGLFDKKGTSITDLAQPGKVTILDVSCYATMASGWKIKCLVVGLISQKLFMQRMLVRKNEEFAQVHETMRYFGGSEEKKQAFPLVWVVIDEAHEFLPRQGKTTASAPLITILREGRQPGISLILATQQPGKIHTDVMTQSDTVISHRITAKIDTEALGTLMQSYMREGLTSMLDHLPRTKGSALIFDDTNEKMFPIKIRPRFTWHGGESPTAMHDVKEAMKFI